ncbi:hypothetical protein DV735_g5106, partial [Chaetothyriales sp. CBS 134920]
MSFLESIVNSIGGDRAPPPPPPPPQKPSNRLVPSESAPAATNSSKNIPRLGASGASAGIKRKAEDDGFRGGAKTSRSTTPIAAIPPRGGASLSGKAALPKSPAPQSTSKAKSPAPQTLKPVAVNPTATSNPPKKGSYAEMMARAKQSAEQRANSQVGIIRHQETKKERMSRLAEKRKAGQNKSNKALKPAAALKKEEKVVGRGSSAMEAGFDDVEDEEELALRAAREDDARELALENQLKREKEERRKKLLGLVKKQR